MQAYLSRRERQISDIVFARKEATVLEIQASLPDPPTATAIRTMLRILEVKGVLRRKKRGREFVYMPKVSRRRAGVAALRHVIETFFEGSLESALASQLAQSKASYSEEELKRMVRLIEEARTKGKTDDQSD